MLVQKLHIENPQDEGHDGYNLWSTTRVQSMDRIREYRKEDWGWEGV